MSYFIPLLVFVLLIALGADYNRQDLLPHVARKEATRSGVQVYLNSQFGQDGDGRRGVGETAPAGKAGQARMAGRGAGVLR